MSKLWIVAAAFAPIFLVISGAYAYTHLKNEVQLLEAFYTTNILLIVTLILAIIAFLPLIFVLRTCDSVLQAVIVLTMAIVHLVYLHNTFSLVYSRNCAIADMVIGCLVACCGSELSRQNHKSRSSSNEKDVSVAPATIDEPGFLVVAVAPSTTPV